MGPLFQGPAAEQALVQAQIDIGKLETEVAHLTGAVNDLKASNKALGEQLAAIQRTLSEASGGWRMLMLMGGAGAAAGGFISWALTNLRWKV
jgi:hypothetical protein